ncbi:hypothetical protein [Natrarchaeobius oligotrophus]|uniref:Uncharacterized protein n=1 Tax=Natrarchaeobius chitinivorans TaxID=1679083 RepID=A0A3N6MII7_NATCH|nr:hypothetical protein [Natrarchaeobius chitinivorans]RQH00985.1 hypothetical protein EA472_10230 [Natrarchaeobius chitinivorans]
MGSEQRSVLERLRQPEYTGENRCIPCTAVNFVIAVALAGAVAVVAPLAAPPVLAVSLAAIYFRGYLVPGTPTLTKRYFPDRLLAKFDKQPAPGGGALEGDAATKTEGARADGRPAGATDEATVDPLDPESTFLAHEVVVPCRDLPAPDADLPDDDLCLTRAVERAWRDEIETLRDGDRDAQVGAFLETDPELVSVENPSRGEGVRARIDGRLAARWESDAALVADLAGAAVLEERLPDWDRLPIETRSQLTNGLRTFVDRCPTCDGDISLDEETVESCCRSRDVYAITCEDCDARILEVPQ